MGTVSANERPISLHHFILGRPPKGFIVDHINGNPSDNRRANLRFCRHSENMKNRRKSRASMSPYKGIWLQRNTGAWRVQIECDGTRIDLGTFKDAEAAARQYDRAARVFHGEFARTNAMLGLL